MTKTRKYLKTNAKRVGIGIGTVAIIIAGVAGFSAFESHIINVTARIENALAVPTDAIDFGTVFPQEKLLSGEIRVALSDSFMEENRVDDITYTIKQKPKVKLFEDDVDNPHTSPTPGEPYANIQVGQFDGPAWQYCEENLPEDAPYSVTEDTLDDEYWQYCYLPLSNYLSKHKGSDGPETDVEVDAFHEAYLWEDGVELNPNFIAGGHLAKSEQDTEDFWIIDLVVPCFVNHCAQDWADFVEETNPDADPDAFMLPEILEHLVFGTDLWIEVSGVSLSEDDDRETVGAVLGDYTAPACDDTVSGAQSIQALIDAAVAPTVICVDTDYDNTGDTGPIVINKDGITLAGLGSAGTAVLDSGVIVQADSATIEGLEIQPGDAEGTIAAVYIKDGTDGLTIRDNDINGPSANDVVTPGGSRGIINVAGGTFSSILIENNLIHEFTTGIYINPGPSVGSPFTIRSNDIDDNLAGIGELNDALVTMNEFENIVAGSEAIGVGPTYDGSVVEFNNFLDGTMLNTYVGPITPDVDAENNFWGPNGGAAQTGGTNEVDFTPEEVSAFPHN